MSHEAEKLYRAAVTLPESERAALVVKLLDSIGAADDAVVAAQCDESRERLEAARSGALDLIDDDDARRLIEG